MGTIIAFGGISRDGRADMEVCPPAENLNRALIHEGAAPEAVMHPDG